MATATNKATLNCSFCKKSNQEVKTIISGPGVYICDECIGLCNTIIDNPSKEVGGHPSLDDGPVERLLAIFGGMVATSRELDERLGVWARTLSERGVPASAIATVAGLSGAEAAERFGL